MQTDFVSQLREALGFIEKPKKKHDVGNGNRNSARREEMRRLRFQEQLTIQEIADKYGISRERVRQIIGNTGAGYKQKRRKAFVKSHPEMTNDVIASAIGCSEGTISQYRNGQRHALKGGNIKRGADVENAVSSILSLNGVANELMPHHHPFDILVGNGKRLEVKSSFKMMKPKSAKCAYYSFNTGRKSRIGNCDFFALVIVPTMDIFIVPSSEVTYQIHIIYPAKTKTKWEQYHNRFDLLK